ncbi:hypothetical protein H6G36_29240 [Anabaena minutissima FACHB-250]|nr:hypothetical protein [Anabaena minutissima FACHB-250]
MIHLTFNTLEDCQSALVQIDFKIRSLVTSFNPSAIDEAGIIPRNAATNQLTVDATKTNTWAIPQQRKDGKWIFPKPTGDIHSMFANVDFLEGVDGCTEEEFNSNWFDPSEI